MLAQSAEKVSLDPVKYETPSLHHLGRAQDLVLRGNPGPYVDNMEPLVDSGGQFPG